MTHQDNLAAVRAACVAASGKNTTEGCICSPIVVCASHAALERFDPTLPDVLLALGKFQENEERLVTITLSDEGKLAISVFGDDDIEFWNLRLPLSGQSEETVAYLAALLKPND